VIIGVEFCRSLCSVVFTGKTPASSWYGFHPKQSVFSLWSPSSEDEELMDV
jgi:hypothetical protein